MTRYLYILSLERSGSTPLAWNLGGRPGMVALGEIDRTLALIVRPQGLPARPCSCGALGADCPVWGPVVAAAGALRPLPLAGRYRLLDGILADRLAGSVVVDASKSLETWQALAGIAPGRVAAVHLVKDVRSYLDSTLQRMATMPGERLWSEQMARRPLVTRLRRAMPQSLIYLARWHRRNHAMETALAAGDAPWLRLGYDALCAKPEHWLGELAGLAGARAGASGHHILFGSFGYLDGSGDKGLRPDLRWQTSPRRRLLDLVALAVHRANRRWAAEAAGGAR